MDCWQYQDTVRTRLQAEGVYFMRAYHATSLCMPSRATVQTGLFPWNSGVIDASHISPTHFNSSNGLNECVWEYTLARMLHDARGIACPNGYNTAFFGKYCNANWFSNMPNIDPVDGRNTTPPGWDYFLMSETGTGDPFPFNYLLWEHGLEGLGGERGKLPTFGNAEATNKTPGVDQTKVIDYKFQTIVPGHGLASRNPLVNPDATYDTDYKQDVYRMKAAAVLDQFILERVTNGKPFFMQMSFNSPHIQSDQPWRYSKGFSPKAAQIRDATFINSTNFHQLDLNGQSAADQIASSTAGGSPANDQQSKRRGQCYMVGSVDDGLDMIFQKLDAAGLTDNTLVIFLGDNGLASGENWVVGGKQDRFEPASLTGMFMRGPQFGRGTTPAYAQGATSQLCCTADIVPTVIDLVNSYGAAAVPRLAGGITTFDGISLLAPSLSTTRNIVPLFDTEGADGNAGFVGVITPQYKYVELTGTGSVGSPQQFQFFRLADDIDSVYASTPTEVIKGVTVPAMTYPIAQELHNLCNVNTGALIPSETALASTLSTLRARLTALQSCQGDTCKLTVP